MSCSSCPKAHRPGLARAVRHPGLRGHRRDHDRGAAVGLDEFTDVVRDRIAAAQVAGFDETGLCGGWLAWAYCARTGKHYALAAAYSSSKTITSLHSRLANTRRQQRFRTRHPHDQTQTEGLRLPAQTHRSPMANCRWMVLLSMLRTSLLFLSSSHTFT